MFRTESRGRIILVLIVIVILFLRS